MRKNGKLLKEVIERQGLILVNSTNKCTGTIARFCKTINSIERSILDFYIVCQEFYDLITSMTIDEDRIHVLTHYGKDNVDDDHEALFSIERK